MTAVLEKWESIYFNILSKAQDVCAREGIGLWLADAAALSAFRDGRLTFTDVNVYARAQDAVRLEKALRGETTGSFGVESMITNGDYPRYEIRLFDPSTIDCDTNDFFNIENNCMHVTVHLLRPSDAAKGKAAGYLKRLEKKLLRADRLFARWSAEASKQEGSLKAAGCVFERGLFEKSKELSLYGKAFSIPEDYDAFFTAQFGPGWEYAEIAEFTPDDDRFLSTDISWKEWKSRVPAEDISAYEKLFKEYRTESAEFRKTHREIEKCYRVSDQAADKIFFYRELSGREDELKAMLDKGSYDLLEAELKPYLYAIKKHHDAGLDLYIDERLTDIVTALLEHKGMTAFVKDITKLIPQNRKPVALTDYSGRPLEVLPPRTDPRDSEKDLENGVLSETQERLLTLMKKVDAFLREKDIEYFLFGGSLLGAIRHDGFIPWDDDIDIVMSRDNYYKLIAVSDDLPWDDITFDCYEKNHAFQRPFGMFTQLSDTRFVKTRIFMGGVGMGTGIDVFVMDNIPREHLDEYLRDSLLYQEILSDVFINNARILEYKDEYYACKEREDATSKAEETARRIEALEKYGSRKPDDLQVVRLWARRPRIYEPGQMDDPVYHKFEDTEFPVPVRAVECLEMQYGSDWNVIPEGAGRKSHAFRVDYEISANNYYRLIDESVDWDRVFAALDKRKRLRLKVFDKKQKLDGYRKAFARSASEHD